MYRTKTVTVQASPESGLQDSSMEVLIFEPEGEGPHPALVIAQHIPLAHTGLDKDEWQIDVGERYAKAGYLVAMPFIFHWWPKDAEMQIKRDEFRDDNTVRDLRASVDLVCALPNVDAERIGMLGHCWGGRVSWLGLCHIKEFKVGVMFYGGRIRLPFADGAIAPIELASNIRCPVLGIFGNDDQNPSPEDVDAYQSALQAAAVEHEFLRYDDAGHAFQDYTKPERYRAQQSDDAWSKCIAYLDRHLK